MLPFCLFRDLSKLENVSLISILAVASVMGVVWAEFGLGKNCPEPLANRSNCPRTDEPVDFTGSNPLAAFGTIPVILQSLVALPTSLNMSTR